MLIDCDTCVMRDIACGDCVVSFFATQAGAAPSSRHELSAAEGRAVAVLAGSGLVPPLRLRPTRAAHAG